MQVKSKNRQAYTGSKIPADSPNFVNLPGSVVQDRDDNGKHATSTQYQGPVVTRRISANLGLNFNSAYLKALKRIIFLYYLPASIHHIVDKRIKLNLLSKLSYLKPNFALTLDYLNLVLNDTVLVIFKFKPRDLKIDLYVFIMSQYPSISYNGFLVWRTYICRKRNTPTGAALDTIMGCSSVVV